MSENGSEILSASSIMEMCNTLQVPQIVYVMQCKETINDTDNNQDEGNLNNVYEVIMNQYNDDIVNQKELKKENKKWFGPTELTNVLYSKSSAMLRNELMKWIVVFGILFGSFSSITLIPFHNVIKFPEYCHEVLIPGVFGLYPCIVPFYLIQCSTIMEYPPLKSPRVIFSMFVTTALAAIVTYLIQYVVWVIYLGYNPPMPFFVYLLAYVSMVTLFIRIWFQFPRYLRKAPKYRKRLKAYYCYVLWVATFTIQFMVIQKICVIMNPQIQWIIAIVLTITKKLNAMILNHLLCMAAGPKKSKAKGMAKLQVELAFSFFIVIIIGSKATDFTTYSILGLNFLLNILLCINIIRTHKKVADISSKLLEVRNKTKREMITELILNETVEFVVPVMFMVTFAITFYGPNAYIIGNVRNAYWQYQKVDNINLYLTGAFKMTLIDALSGVISSILLRWFCNINAISIFIKVIKEYGLLLAFNIILAMNQVRNRILPEIDTHISIYIYFKYHKIKITSYISEALVSYDCIRNRHYWSVCLD